MKKQAIVKLLNGAKVDKATGRPGKVLKVVGTNAGAVVGNFYEHPLKYVSEHRDKILHNRLL